MASVSTVGASAEGEAEWTRRYPPLAGIVVALVVALVVMPSSLNLPRSNPSTTLEFAPVAPQDDRPPPFPGNMSSLGLTSSTGLEAGGLEGGDGGGGSGLPPGGPGGRGKSPRTKRCVGNPPRQTEDPLSPPCVADFAGDNFGATYQGVTRDEIRILFYMRGVTNLNACTDPNKTTPQGQYFDLAQPGDPDEHCALTALRVWQSYFNERYQTYDRKAHFFVYFSYKSPDTPEARRADAADNFNRVRPFAVISNENAQVDEYFQAMAAKGVLAFDSTFGRDAEFFRAHPGMIWGYLPPAQQLAEMYSSLLCRKVIGKPVTRFSHPGDEGKERKFGLVYTTDETRPDLRLFKDHVIIATKRRCGFDLGSVPTHTFPRAGWNVDGAAPSYARNAMADFKSKGVTTIIWPGGYENHMSKAAAAQPGGYFPEIIVAGDRLMESQYNAQDQDQRFWNNAWVMTNMTAILKSEKRPCYEAYMETDPDAYKPTVDHIGCLMYDSIRQLFTGIQVAGPRLTPSAMDRGFHAIPRIASTDPAVPACFYETDDYTCVKDAMLEKWDAEATNTTGGRNPRGCWRMIESGRRYYADIWPDGNIDAQFKPDAPCNTYTTGGQFRTGV